MEPDLWQSRPFQHPVEHVEHAVLGHGAACGTGEYPEAAPHFLFLLIQNVYCIPCQGQGAVGVFCFQGSLHHLTFAVSELLPRSMGLHCIVQLKRARSLRPPGRLLFILLNPLLLPKKHVFLEIFGGKPLK